MDILQECAKAFQHLLNIKYRIIIGRKGQLVELEIFFSDTEFHHLAGLHKLRDLRVRTQNRTRVFEDLVNEKICLEDIKKSSDFSQIQNRFLPLSQLETLLDNNNLVFKYSPRNNGMSKIHAEYLLCTPYDATDIYIFLDLKDAANHFFCRSFFPKEKTDYTVGQTKYTLLFKEKINLCTGESIVQYDKLTPKPKE